MKKAILILISLSSLIGCDRVTKSQAITYLKDKEPVSYINGLFNLTYYENTGGMLSIGSKLPDSIRFYIFIVGVACILIFGLIYIIVKPLNKIALLSGLLILGGGLGNLYDRAFNQGVVIDFMLIDMGIIKTGVFNVADIAIMAGAFGLLLLNVKKTEN